MMTWWQSTVHAESVAGRAVASRWRLALLHLVGSVGVVGLVTVVLVRLWFPAPYSKLSGGLELLALLLTVDVVVGPVLTVVVASPGKPLRVLARDLLVILALQLGAFGYGLYTLAFARPVGLVFEVNHLRVISSADIDSDLLRDAPADMRQLSWTGPRVFASVKPTDGKQLLEAIDYGLAGVDLAMLPKHWRPYAALQTEVLKVAAPVARLLAEHPRATAEVQRFAGAAGVPVDQLRVLPIRARKADDWVALVAPTDARIIGLLDPTAAPP
jgi:hypothetical protein